MNPRRTLINVVTFLALASLLVYVGVTQFLFPPEEGRSLTIQAQDAAGVLPRSDVTVRGVPSGQVTDVALTDRGTTEIGVTLDPGVAVPRGTTATITRRSPIGDITIDL